jgi:hypothetical protein
LSSFAVVIPYFNPYGYRSHAMKLARCLEAFERVGLGADVFVAGCGALRPHTGNVLLWDDHDCFMWHKERLVNLAAKQLASGYTHLVWADNDILVRPGWPLEVERSFATAPIVQCFRDVTLLGPDWRPKECRPSYLRAGSNGSIGCVWGASCSFFVDGPGLFELALVGGGDSVLGSALLRGEPAPSARWTGRQDKRRHWSAALLSSLDRWTGELEAWLLDDRPTWVASDIDVFEHGRYEDRQYKERHSLLASLEPDVHLVVEEDRVFRWSESGRELIEPAVRDYFEARREDDGWI